MSPEVISVFGASAPSTEPTPEAVPKDAVPIKAIATGTSPVAANTMPATIHSALRPNFHNPTLDVGEVAELFMALDKKDKIVFMAIVMRHNRPSQLPLN